MESASNETTAVRVVGDATENLIVTITPLTVGQYQADRSRYRNRCDSAVATSSTVSDFAESKCCTIICKGACTIHAQYGLGPPLELRPYTCDEAR
jgi:hypothetical protein